MQCDITLRLLSFAFIFTIVVCFVPRMEALQGPRLFVITAAHAIDSSALPYVSISNPTTSSVLRTGNLVAGAWSRLSVELGSQTWKVSLNDDLGLVQSSIILPSLILSDDTFLLLQDSLSLVSSGGYNSFVTSFQLLSKSSWESASLPISNDFIGFAFINNAGLTYPIIMSCSFALNPVESITSDILGNGDVKFFRVRIHNVNGIQGKCIAKSPAFSSMIVTTTSFSVDYSLLKGRMVCISFQQSKSSSALKRNFAIGVYTNVIADYFQYPPSSNASLIPSNVYSRMIGLGTNIFSGFDVSSGYSRFGSLKSVKLAVARVSSGPSSSSAQDRFPFLYAMSASSSMFNFGSTNRVQTNSALLLIGSWLTMFLEAGSEWILNFNLVVADSSLCTSVSCRPVYQKVTVIGMLGTAFTSIIDSTIILYYNISNLSWFSKSFLSPIVNFVGSHPIFQIGNFIDSSSATILCKHSLTSTTIKISLSPMQWSTQVLNLSSVDAAGNWNCSGTLPGHSTLTTSTSFVLAPSPLSHSVIIPLFLSERGYYTIVPYGTVYNATNDVFQWLFISSIVSSLNADRHIANGSKLLQITIVMTVTSSRMTYFPIPSLLTDSGMLTIHGLYSGQWSRVGLLHSNSRWNLYLRQYGTSDIDIDYKNVKQVDISCIYSCMGSGLLVISMESLVSLLPVAKFISRSEFLFGNFQTVLSSRNVGFHLENNIGYQLLVNIHCVIESNKSSSSIYTVDTNLQVTQHSRKTLSFDVSGIYNVNCVATDVNKSKSIATLTFSFDSSHILNEIVYISIQQSESSGSKLIIYDLLVFCTASVTTYDSPVGLTTSYPFPEPNSVFPFSNVAISDKISKFSTSARLSRVVLSWTRIGAARSDESFILGVNMGASFQHLLLLLTPIVIGEWNAVVVDSAMPYRLIWYSSSNQIPELIKINSGSNIGYFEPYINECYFSIATLIVISSQPNSIGWLFNDDARQFGTSKGWGARFDLSVVGIIWYNYLSDGKTVQLQCTGGNTVNLGSFSIYYSNTTISTFNSKRFQCKAFDNRNVLLADAYLGISPSLDDITGHVLVIVIGEDQTGEIRLGFYADKASMNVNSYSRYSFNFIKFLSSSTYRCFGLYAKASYYASVTDGSISSSVVLVMSSPDFLFGNNPPYFTIKNPSGFMLKSIRMMSGGWSRFLTDALLIGWKIDIVGSLDDSILFPNVRCGESFDRPSIISIYFNSVTKKPSSIILTKESFDNLDDASFGIAIANTVGTGATIAVQCCYDKICFQEIVSDADIVKLIFSRLSFASSSIEFSCVVLENGIASNQAYVSFQVSFDIMAANFILLNILQSQLSTISRRDYRLSVYSSVVAEKFISQGDNSWKRVIYPENNVFTLIVENDVFTKYSVSITCNSIPVSPSYQFVGVLNYGEKHSKILPYPLPTYLNCTAIWPSSSGLINVPPTIVNIAVAIPSNTSYALQLFLQTSSDSALYIFKTMLTQTSTLNKNLIEKDVPSRKSVVMLISVMQGITLITFPFDAGGGDYNIIGTASFVTIALSRLSSNDENNVNHRFFITLPSVAGVVSKGYSSYLQPSEWNVILVHEGVSFIKLEYTCNVTSDYFNKFIQLEKFRFSFIAVFGATIPLSSQIFVTNPNLSSDAMHVYFLNALDPKDSASVSFSCFSVLYPSYKILTSAIPPGQMTSSVFSSSVSKLSCAVTNTLSTTSQTSSSIQFNINFVPSRNAVIISAFKSSSSNGVIPLVYANAIDISDINQFVSFESVTVTEMPITLAPYRSIIHPFFFINVVVVSCIPPSVIGFIPVLSLTDTSYSFELVTGALSIGDWGRLYPPAYAGALLPKLKNSNNMVFAEFFYNRSVSGEYDSIILIIIFDGILDLIVVEKSSFQTKMEVECQSLKSSPACIGFQIGNHAGLSKVSVQIQCVCGSKIIDSKLLKVHEKHVTAFLYSSPSNKFPMAWECKAISDRNDILATLAFTLSSNIQGFIYVSFMETDESTLQSSKYSLGVYTTGVIEDPPRFSGIDVIQSDAYKKTASIQFFDATVSRTTDFDSSNALSLAFVASYPSSLKTKSLPHVSLSNLLPWQWDSVALDAGSLWRQRMGTPFFLNLIRGYQSIFQSSLFFVKRSIVLWESVLALKKYGTVAFPSGGIGSAEVGFGVFSLINNNAPVSCNCSTNNEKPLTMTLTQSKPFYGVIKPDRVGIFHYYCTVAFAGKTYSSSFLFDSSSSSLGNGYFLIFGISSDGSYGLSLLSNSLSANRMSFKFITPKSSGLNCWAPFPVSNNPTIDMTQLSTVVFAMATTLQSPVIIKVNPLGLVSGVLSQAGQSSVITIYSDSINISIDVMDAVTGKIITHNLRCGEFINGSTLFLLKKGLTASLVLSSEKYSNIRYNNEFGNDQVTGYILKNNYGATVFMSCFKGYDESTLKSDTSQTFQYIQMKSFSFSCSCYPYDTPSKIAYLKFSVDSFIAYGRIFLISCESIPETPPTDVVLRIYTTAASMIVYPYRLGNFAYYLSTDFVGVKLPLVFTPSFSQSYSYSVWVSVIGFYHKIFFTNSVPSSSVHSATLSIGNWSGGVFDLGAIWAVSVTNSSSSNDVLIVDYYSIGVVRNNLFIFTAIPNISVIRIVPDILTLSSNTFGLVFVNTHSTLFSLNCTSTPGLSYSLSAYNMTVSSGLVRTVSVVQSIKVIPSKWTCFLSTQSSVSTSFSINAKINGHVIAIIAFNDHKGNLVVSPYSTDSSLVKTGENKQSVVFSSLFDVKSSLSSYSIIGIGTDIFLSGGTTESFSFALCFIHIVVYLMFI